MEEVFTRKQSSMKKPYISFSSGEKKILMQKFQEVSFLKNFQCFKFYNFFNDRIHFRQNTKHH